MKYLKLFENYSEKDVEEKVKDFSTPYLAYLLDMEYEFYIKYYPHLSRLGNSKSCSITLKKKPLIDIVSVYRDVCNGLLEDGEFTRLSNELNNNPELFDWDDVKDYLIPFIQVLEDEYKLYGTVDFNFINIKNSKQSISINKLISDDNIKINDIFNLSIYFDL